MRQILAHACVGRGEARVNLRGQFTHAELRRPVAIENAENVGQVLFARRFIERKTNALLIEAAEIHPVRFSEPRYFRGPCAHAHPNRIEKRLRPGGVT